jgi:hypothetical protein
VASVTELRVAFPVKISARRWRTTATRWFEGLSHPAEVGEERGRALRRQGAGHRCSVGDDGGAGRELGLACGG